MNTERQNGKPDESALVELYSELTGLPESQGRSVFMYACCKEGEDDEVVKGELTEAMEAEQPARESEGDYTSRRARLQGGMAVLLSSPAPET